MRASRRIDEAYSEISFRNELGKIAQMPEVCERVEGLGFQFVMNTPEQFMAQQRYEAEKWTRVVKNSKVRMQ